MHDRLTAIIRLFFAKSEASSIDRRWLFRSSSRLDQAFWHKHKGSFQTNQEQGEWKKVVIDNQIYLWPSKAPLRTLSQILSELLQPTHPHHYDWGITRINKGDTVLDIGACEGAFAADCTTRGAQVIMVEPSRLMGRLVHDLFRIRGLPAPSILPYLISDQPGSIWFTDCIENPGASRMSPAPEPESYRVDVMTLDGLIERFLPEGCDFIKCDAEGWDPAIMGSGRNSLQRFKPKIAVTTYHQDGDFTKISGLLSPMGYEIKGKGLLFSQDHFRPLMLHARHTDHG